MKKCPQCGYSPPADKKRVVKIWMAGSLEDVWDNFAKDFETKELAFEALLKKSGLLKEKARAYVEAPTPAQK